MFSDYVPTLLFYSIVLLATLAQAQFEYFGDGIDYWKTPQDPRPPATTSSEAPKDAKSSSSFDWKPYLDPNQKEFFKEGDYVPPEPFMEIVRHPTDENLRLWFAYIDKKNQLAQRLQERIQTYVATNQVPTEMKVELTKKISALPALPPDVKRYRFRMYFDSTCPHCKRMFATLVELEQRGYYVEAKQIDRNPMRDLPIPVSPASSDEVKKQNVQTVPLLLIGDLEKKAVYKLTGYQTLENVFNAIGQGRNL